MKCNPPSGSHLAYSRERIADRLRQLGPVVSKWVGEAQAKTRTPVLAVCVLRGAAFFFTDLLRELTVSVEPTYCRTWGYSSETNERTGGAVRVAVDDVVAEGRALLVVDDICDTGATLSKLKHVFLDLGASEVKTCVLIHRVLHPAVFTPDWCAFEHHGSEWFLGYGMEDKNQFSNLPAVYLLKQSSS